MTAEARIVAENEADIRLDRWLRRHFSALPQGMIERLCRTGSLRVDGKRVAASSRLAPGQVVRVPPLPTIPFQAAPPPDPELARELVARVLYRDAALLVLDKPGGLPVQGGPGIARHLDGMLDALRFGAPERPRLVHRLDRDTAGVLVLARNASAAARLAAAFRGRDVTKTYWAVVIGCPQSASGRIDVPLVRSRNPRFGRTTPALEQSGTRAVTTYRTLDRAGNRFAWLELSPLTGRTHQLRVHCVTLGTPILGDIIYGGQEALAAGFSGALHLFARAISLPHPDGGQLAVEAPLPPHFAETFRLLGFRAPPPGPPARS